MTQQDEKQDLGRSTILVVDDDEDNRTLVARVLRRAEFNVVTAANGREALEKVLEQRTDLVILDVMMPEIDGYEVYHRLKESDRTRNIPIIMLTALNMADQVEKALNIAPSWYIAKPFDARYLLKRVRQVLFSARNPRPLSS